MGAAVKITRSDHTAAALRGLAAKSNDGAQVRRLLALALILEGHPRREAAERDEPDGVQQRPGELHTQHRLEHAEPAGRNACHPDTIRRGRRERVCTRTHRKTL